MNIEHEKSLPGTQPAPTNCETRAGGNGSRLAGWRVNRRRVRWLLAALAVLGCASVWFCWLQPPAPVGLAPARFPAPHWWWRPVEINPHRRLPLVPTANLQGCYFTNDQGWVVGTGGVILHTPDGGRTWQAQTNVVWEEERPAVAVELDSLSQGAYDAGNKANLSTRQFTAQSQQGQIKNAPPPKAAQDKSDAVPPIDLPLLPPAPVALSDVQFVDAQRGWAVGSRGTILHTADGGRHWESQVSGTREFLRSVAFVDAQHGWVVGTRGTILHSTDGGQTWEPQTADTRETLNSVVFVDTQLGWAVGNQVEIWHTIDGGKTWKAQTSTTGVTLFSVAFADADNGWVAGSAGTILHTTDGGRTWRPQDSNTKAALASVKFLDSRRGWVVGDDSTIRHTADGGKTWTAQTAPRGLSLGSVAIADARRMWAVGDEGTVLHTSDSGHTWAACTANATGTLAAIEVQNDRALWAVGERGVVLHSADGGTSWTQHSTGTENFLTSIAFVDSHRGWLVGRGGTLRQTVDGGRTWTATSVNTDRDLWSVAFADGQHGWVVGDGGTVLHTEDGGQTWLPKTVPSFERLLSVAFGGPKYGFIVSESGGILLTEDGGQSWIQGYLGNKEHVRMVELVDIGHAWAVGSDGALFESQDLGKTWNVRTAGSKAGLRAVTFADPQRGWVVGKYGTILHTTDGGKTWQPQSAQTTASLASVAFADAKHGWVAGEAGTLLRTTDGGETWSDPRQYRRYPAPLFYPGLIAAGFLAWWGFRPRKETDPAGPVPVRSIADYAVSDRPLTSKDFDALNFGPLAEGIANYLRNENTTGPLTLAVTGAWGSGKSSIMGLLKEKLEARGFRPVWFNAWHHQQEEQLLAALLESIRLQAVPSWLSLAGLQFRARLIYERLRRRWPAVLLGGAAVAALAAVIANLGGDWTAWLQNLSASSWPVLAGKLAVAAGAMAAAFKGLQGLKAFGVDPARLLASVTEQAKLSDLGAQTSFRHRFAQEFREVTTALQPRTMTIFIDDLDRCEPPQVMQVMQALNFLASSGECFLVVGMQEEAVTNCVAVSLKEQFDVQQGRELKPEEKAKQRWEYAANWMEKLIQIRIAVPSPDDEQFKALLRGVQADAHAAEPGGLAARWRAWAPEAWERARPFAFFAAALALMAGGYFGVNRLIASSAKRGTLPPRHATETPVAWSSNSVIAPDVLAGITLESPEGVLGANLITNADFTNWVASQKWTVQLQFEPRERMETQAPTTETNALSASTGGRPAVREPDRPTAPLVVAVQPGQTDHSGSWVALVALMALLVYGGKRLVDYFNQQVQDSEDFRDALARWSGRISELHPTPRGAKRLVNKLRFYAMVMRALRAAAIGPQVPENAIVAFGVLEDRITNGRVAEEPDGLGAGCQQDIADLQASLAQYPDIFRYLRVSVVAGIKTREAAHA